MHFFIIFVYSTVLLKFKCGAYNLQWHIPVSSPVSPDIIMVLDGVHLAVVSNDADRVAFGDGGIIPVSSSSAVVACMVMGEDSEDGAFPQTWGDRNVEGASLLSVELVELLGVSVCRTVP